MSNAPANWYPDPQDARQLRYWDGVTWTEHRAPNPAAQTPQAAPAPMTPSEPAAPVQPPVQAQSVSPAAEQKVPLFGARNVARQQAEELERLRAEMARLGVLDVADLQRQRDHLQAEVHAQQSRLTAERAELERQLHELQQRVVLTQEEEILQEVGVYRYRRSSPR